MTDRFVLSLFLSIVRLKVPVFIEDLHSGRACASWTVFEVGLLPSFGREVTEQVLELPVLTEGFLGGRELESKTTVGVGLGFPPSFGEQG